jgi:hypothetical protein
MYLNGHLQCQHGDKVALVWLFLEHCLVLRVTEVKSSFSLSFFFLGSAIKQSRENPAASTASCFVVVGINPYCATVPPIETPLEIPLSLRSALLVKLPNLPTVLAPAFSISSFVYAIEIPRSS